MMFVDDILMRAAEVRPDKTALVCGSVRVTYAALRARVEDAAARMCAAGIERGDRVAICLDNSVDVVVAIFATLRAGAAVMLVNPQIKAKKLAFLLDDAAPTGIITSAQTAAASETVIARAGSLRAIFLTGAAHGPTLPGCGARVWRFDDSERCLARLPARSDHDLAFLLYTSGSSGPPKGVMHAHRGVSTVTGSIVGYLGLHDDDVLFQVLPMSFGYGLTQLLTAFEAGATLVLERSFAFPHAALDRLSAERCTVFALVPTMATLLVHSDLSVHDLSSLRLVTSAGAALAPAVALTLKRLVPQADVVVMYGQTECIRASYLPPNELTRRPHSVGRGIPRQEMWIVDERGARISGVGQGELVLRGIHVMRGYWRPGGKTTDLDDGERTLHTGDIFAVDNAGFFSFVARKDDVIKTRGEKVSPAEVEAALLGHASVLEAAVIGAADALLGQAVHAFVTVRADAKGIDERALLRHCAQHVEEHAVPRRLAIIPEMPKSDNGKIDKRALGALEEARAQ